MKSFALTATVLSLLSLSTARTVGFAAPAQVAADTTVQFEIIGENYIQAVQDVAIAFGYANTAYPESLGTLLSEKYLGPDESNKVGNITHYVHIPSGVSGNLTITAALFSLVGAALEPATQLFALNTTVAGYNSFEYVDSVYVF